MALIIKGRKNIDFHNKEGEHIQGVKLHCIYQESSPTEGQLCELIFVGINKPIYPTACQFPFGTVITPVYNRNGKVDDFILRELPAGLGPDGKPLSEVPGKPGK